MKTARSAASSFGALLAVLVAIGWIMGSDTYPFDIRRQAWDHDSALVGTQRTMHLGAYHGGTYYSHDVIRIESIDAEWRNPSGSREWYFGPDRRRWYLPGMFGAEETYRPPQSGDVLAPNWRAAGFRAYQFSALGDEGFAIVAPDWFLIAVGLLPAALWLRRRLRRSRRLASGRCPHCGYELRGNVSGICPECGTAADR